MARSRGHVGEAPGSESDGHWGSDGISFLPAYTAPHPTPPHVGEPASVPFPRPGLGCWRCQPLAASPLLAWCPCRLAGEPQPGSHVALILLFSGRLGTLSTAFASPLGAPFTAPALASGDAPEPAVASGAWLGTRDPRRQLRQHHEHHGHPLGICTYPLSAAWPARCSCPALPCPPARPHCSSAFIFLIRE